MTNRDLERTLDASLEAAGYAASRSNRDDMLLAMMCDVEWDAEETICAAIDSAVDAVGDDLIEQEHENPNDEYDPCSKHE